MIPLSSVSRSRVCWTNAASDGFKFLLAAALVLGVLILLTLHIWQVEPGELLRIVYRKPGFLHRHARYNALFFLLLGWVAASWGIGCAVYKARHHREDEEE